MKQLFWPSILGIAIAVCILSVCHSTTEAASRVVIRAEASVDYEREHQTVKKDKPTTYHFVEGKFFKGHMRDSSLTGVSFFDIAENLATHLAKQNYFPSGNAQENEVMILVNWGVTAVEDTFEEIMGIDSTDEYDQLYGSPSVSENESGDTEITYEVTEAPNWEAIGKRANAKMLGFWQPMNDGSLMPTEHYELQTMLNEERYFIVVIAFDNQKYIQGEKDILWATRFSMQARGISFDQAFPELTATASDYFGKHVKGLTQRRSDDKSQVEMGEIEVLNTVED